MAKTDTDTKKPEADASNEQISGIVSGWAAELGASATWDMEGDGDVLTVAVIAPHGPSKHRRTLASWRPSAVRAALADIRENDLKA